MSNVSRITRIHPVSPPSAPLPVPVTAGRPVTALRSVTGPVRRVNQDCVRGLVDATAPDGERLLLLVADGMGGHQGGEVASRLAAEGLTGAFRSGAGQSAERLLDAALRAANHAIRRAAMTRADWLGMGTTLSALLIERGRYVVASVGDSRVYRWRQGRLSLLSTDDTLIGQMTREGRLTAEAAECHPDRHLLTRALGSEDRLVGEVVCARGEVLPGDRFLLCSDGLHDVVDDARLCHLLASGSPHAVADALVAAAERAGSTDNISVAVLDVAAEGAASSAVSRDTRARLA